MGITYQTTGNWCENYSFSTHAKNSVGSLKRSQQAKHSRSSPVSVGTEKRQLSAPHVLASCHISCSSAVTGCEKTKLIGFGHHSLNQILQLFRKQLIRMKKIVIPPLRLPNSLNSNGLLFPLPGVSTLITEAQRKIEFV